MARERQQVHTLPTPQTGPTSHPYLTSMSSNAFLEAPVTMPTSRDDWPIVWAYILPAIDHTMRSTNKAGDGSSPKISVAYSMGIHTAIFNYSTSGLMRGHSDQGAKISVALDQHCCETTRQLLSELEVPEDPAELIRYAMACFDSHNARASVVSHWLGYYDRYWVARGGEAGRGWLKIRPEGPTRIEKNPMQREALEKSQLKQWGLREGSTKAEMAIVEARAEAGTNPDRIVKTRSIALRRFRSMFIEPLLGVDEGGKQEGEGSIQSTGTQGKLASAIEKALEAGDAGLQEEVNKLADMFRRIGMRPDSPWVLKLENYSSAAATE